MSALDTIKSAVLGVPFDPVKKPSRQGVVRAFSEMQDQLEAAQAGAFVRDTKANLDLLLAAPVSAMAWVVNDATTANNGIYQNTGSNVAAVWTRRADIPQFFITGMNTGEGTADAIEITTDKSVPSQDGRAMIAVPIIADNTVSPPTVSINGGAALPIITNSGVDVAIGGLLAGMYVVGFITAGKFRLITNQVDAAIVAAAEAAAEAAEAAAASANGATPVQNRTELAALDTSTKKSAVIYNEGGRNGLFIWSGVDRSTFVTNDPNQGVYVAPASDTTGASGAWVREEFNGASAIDVWFGVIRGNVGATSGTDQRSAIQAAIDFCYSYGLDLYLSRGSIFVGQNGANAYCLLNKGVSMLGLPAKATHSVIAPMPSVPNTADIIRFRPDNNSGQDFIRFENFMINPNQSGTTYGKRAFYMLCDQITNVGQLKISRLYLGKGNDYSIYIENAIAVNAQGNPSNSVIEECSIWEGIYLVGIGDNVSIRDNFIITQDGSARYGIYGYQVDGGGGVASFLEITRNAMNSDNCAIIIDRARNLRIANNNIEHSHATVPTGGAVINLRGSGGVIPLPIVEKNALGLFGGSGAVTGISIQACYFAQVDANNIITDAVRTHGIIIGPTSTNARINHNKIGTGFTNGLTDGGTGSIQTDTVRDNT